MLTFQPALDPFHSVFRALRLAVSLQDCQPVDWDKFRVLDFYLTFPFRLIEFRFRKGQSQLRSIARKYESMRPYSSVPDGQDLLVRMSPVQSLAAQTLAQKGLLNAEKLERDSVALGDQGVPEVILGRINEKNREEADVMGMLRELCLTNPLLGPDGIKARSGLLEYRNDPV